MGAIINLEPELYKGILSGVPFVDVLTTMSDPSIPLTTFEYDEWGNPANIDEYNYIKQYSPYDNIYEANYPIGTWLGEWRWFVRNCPISW